jgi:signal transduction histidine kinase
MVTAHALAAPTRWRLGGRGALPWSITTGIVLLTLSSESEGAVMAGQPDVLGADVLSRLGHELRSPLAGIVGLTRVLLMRINAGAADVPTQVRQLGMIQASAVRSLSTIEQVVDLAKLDSGRVRPVPALVDCRDLVGDVAATLAAAAAERGLRLSADVPERPVMLTSDPAILRRLLSELVSNGLCYTNAGEVRIRLSAGDKPVIMEVSDDGPGIPAGDQARVFEPFERGNFAAERDGSAPGLGLHLARKRADLLGAQLSLASPAGSGSTFTITFADPHGGSSPAAGAEPGSSSWPQS